MTRFISELDPSNPIDASEMAKAVFGEGAGAGPGGTHEERGLCSEWSIRNGRTPPDVLRQHLEAIKRTSGLEAHDREKSRIRDLMRKGGHTPTV